MPVDLLAEAAGSPAKMENANRAVRDALPCPQPHLAGLGGFDKFLLAARGTGSEFRHEEGAAVGAALLELERCPCPRLRAVAAAEAWIEIHAEEVQVAGHPPVIEMGEEPVVENEPAGIRRAQERGLLGDKSD